MESKIRNRRRVMRLLVSDARSWWYYRQMRKAGDIKGAEAKERESVWAHLAQIEQALESGGWLSIGRGGASLHFEPNSRLQTGGSGPFIDACITAGIPTCDSRECEFSDVVNLAIDGPMPGFVDSAFGTNPDGAFSTRHWSIIFDRYARIGAKIYNYTPRG